MQLSFLSLILALGLVLSQGHLASAQLVSAEDRDSFDSKEFDQDIQSNFESRSEHQSEDSDGQESDRDPESDYVESEEESQNSESGDRVSDTAPASAPLAMNTIESINIQTLDGITFTKVNKNRWQTVRSVDPMAVGQTTEITLKILHGHHMHIGFVTETGRRLSYFWVGRIGYSYGTGFGSRCFESVCANLFSDKSEAGDTIKLKLNLTKGCQDLQIFRNDESLGVFFRGFDLDVPLYFAVSLHSINHSFQILDVAEYIE